MIHFKRYTPLLFSIVLMCTFLCSCNNDTADYKVEQADTATAGGGIDTASTMSVEPDAAGTTEPGVTEVDNTTQKNMPEASIAYAYKNKMKRGDKELIQMHVQLDKPLEAVAASLKKSLNEEKAIERGSSDTSLIKSLAIAGAKYFHVTIDYDTAIFGIEKSVGEEKQELNYQKPNKWIWRVTAKKETSKSDIIIIVKTEDEDGKIHESDNGILPVEITVDKPKPAPITPVKPQPSFFDSYKWILLSGAALLILLFVFSTWRKKMRARALNSRIYFSYAWKETGETIIDKLYNSLKKAGFNVIRDKVNLQYRGLISNFMKDIGKSNIVIVVLSDKYLKSKFCMFELFEIYRNCGMNKEAFVKKIFPIREEEINLSDATVIDHYVDYWKAEEVKWEKMIKDKDEEITAEQFSQYEVVRRIGNDLGNLLYFLSDINSLNIELLSKNDFEEIKSALKTAVNSLEET